MLGSLISGASGLLGSALGQRAADKATDKQIAWERERAKNAHQWEVNDLKAAGLNPILSAGGEGAVTGGIDAKMGDYSGVMNAGTNAIGAIQQIASAKKANADAEKQKQETLGVATANENLKLDGILKSKQAGLISAQTAREQAETVLKGLQSTTEAVRPRLLTAEMARAHEEAKRAREQATTENYKKGLLYRQRENLALENQMKDYELKHYRKSFWLNKINQGTNTAKNATGAVKDIAEAIGIDEIIPALIGLKKPVRRTSYR